MKKVTGNPTVDALLAELRLEEKIQLVHGKMADNYLGNQAGFVEGIPRLNIPDIFICDGESGVNVSWDTTALPSKVGLAATFDTKASRLYGRVLGREARGAGMHVILTPRVNIVRDPVADIHGSNGGNYQTYGEDTVLNGLMGAAEAQGIQEDNNCIANLKQMFGSSTGTAQGSPACIIGRQALREIYMRVFEEPIRAGVGSAMTNYNQVNGLWTSACSEMCQTLCRDEWGLKGFIVDDWHCLFDPRAIMGAVTLEMPGDDYAGAGNERSVYGRRLMEEIQNPASPVTEDHLDRAVGYLLDTLYRFDMLAKPRRPGPLSAKLKGQGIADARALGAQTAVLLQNSGGVLPLNPKKDKLALIGPTARQTAMPVFKEASYGFPDRKIGPMAALQEQMDNEIRFALGNDLEGVMVPSACLIPQAGDICGLTRYETALPNAGSHETLNAALAEQTGTGIDAEINFAGATALPPLPLRFEESTVVPFYVWQGKLLAPETGWYRLSLQTYTPGEEVFRQNITAGREMEIVTSGNLYLRQADEMRHLGSGYRILRNGGASPNSSVAPCLDGWNNVGGWVYMEAKESYALCLSACSIYNQPVGVRLHWVTPSMRNENIRQAALAASCADKAVVFAWHKSPSPSLTLDEGQDELIEAVAAANPNTVVVINSGDPVAMPWASRVKAIVAMWYPGQEGGYATADVLTGRVNPSGRLPVTFPRRLEDTAPHAPGFPERCGKQKRLWSNDVASEYVSHFTEGVNVGYRWLDENGIEPLFAFGHGLSYTSFQYENLRLTRTPDGGVEASFTLRNVGGAPGAEAPQCYVHRPAALPQGVKASPKTLAAFEKVWLNAGESKTVRMNVPFSALRHYDEARDTWLLPEGERLFSIAASSRDIRLEGSI